MIKLNSKDYKKIIPLFKSENEISVFSVLYEYKPGEVYVNNVDNPTAALIKNSECNVIAGSPNDEKFNSEIASELDFWDILTPDSEEWIDKIPTIHKNPFVKKYLRRHYVLSIDDFIECDSKLKEGYVLEKIDLSVLKQNLYENSETLLNILNDWGDEEDFNKYGSGYLVRNHKVIVSWSWTDCRFAKKIAIGIHTDEKYRKNGFGMIAASANIKNCFAKGYEKIDWLCVDTNKGSRYIAEKLGFKFNNNYFAFSSYPPIENLKDLSEDEWHQWAKHLEEGSKTQECLIWDCIYCYVKANNVEKTMELMQNLEHKKVEIDYLRFNKWIAYLQTFGICSNFNEQHWINFLNERTINV